MTKLQKLQAAAAELARQIDEERARVAQRRAGIPGKPRRSRPAEWALAPWERRDGRSHVVVMAYSRRTGGQPMFGAWLWEDGRALMCFRTPHDCTWMASHDEICVWDEDDWKAHKSAHPEISAELARVEREYQTRLARYEAARASAAAVA